LSIIDHFLPAIDYLREHDADVKSFDKWTVTRIYGGMNGQTYRVDYTDKVNDSIAIKFRKRDQRQRAQREFTVMTMLQSQNYALAPKPIELITDHPNLPDDVVVMSWIDGTVLNDMSSVSQTTWEHILSAFAQLNTIVESSHVDLAPRAFPLTSTEDLLEEIERRYDRLPDGQIGDMTKTEMRTLLDEFRYEALKTPYQANQLVLCPYDLNPTNMILQGDKIVIIDWEYAGWADPAFTLADLLARPNCVDMSQSMREWTVDRYAALTQSPDIIERVIQYERLMLLFWLFLTSTGFNRQSNDQKTTYFTLEHTLQQQRQYIKRIELTRDSKGMA